MKYARPGFVTPDTLVVLFDEAEMEIDDGPKPDIEDSGSKPKKARKKKRKAIPDHLPRTIKLHDLNDNEKICPEDNSKLTSIGYDIKEELHYTPASFEVIEHRFPKYACKVCQEGVRRVSTLPSLLPKSYASPSLLANIATSKYCNHLPLYRLEQNFSQDGVHITRQVMADWMIKLGNAVSPLIELMREEIFKSDVVSADETPVRLLTKEGERTSTQCYMWQLSRWGPRPYVIFEYDPSRSKSVSERLLGEFEGYIQVDGYAGYNSLFDSVGIRKRVGCLAHCFRKFKDFLKVLPKKDQGDHPSRKIIYMIRQLYTIEESLKTLAPEARYEQRKTAGCEKIVDDLEAFIASEISEVAQSSPYYKALQYSLKELPRVRVYLEHGGIEIDNNMCENAIRPFALGRRNWLFICSEKEAQASANIYSLLITAKANGIKPYDYLKKVIDRMPYCKTTEERKTLLPPAFSN